MDRHDEDNGRNFAKEAKNMPKQEKRHTFTFRRESSVGTPICLRDG